MQVEQLSEMKKKHLKAIKKQDQDIRAKKAVGIWKRRTWKRGGLGRKGSGAVTPVTAPVTRAGSENEDEEDEDENQYEEDDDGAAGENGQEKKMMPIRCRSEGLTVDVCTSSPSQYPTSHDAQTNHITHHSSSLPDCLPHLLCP